MLKDADSKRLTLGATYDDLYKQGENGDFEKALKIVDKILMIAPNDTIALHCKVICFIQLSKFAEASDFIRKHNLTSLIFETAYCYYRLNENNLALDIINKVSSDNLTPHLKELRTQILYRLECYGECFHAYKEIIKNTSDDYEDERLTNLCAVASHLVFDKSNDIPELPETTYEQYFNSSCVLSNADKYDEAEKKLRISEKLCRKTLEEDGFTEEEIREELNVIKTQIAYCFQMQDKTKEATAIYAEVLRQKPRDAALVAVASNNLVVINKYQHVFDSKKKIRACMTEACEQKLTSRQKRSILLNNCLLALCSNTSDQIYQMSQKLVNSYPEMSYQAARILASHLVKNKKQKLAVETLKNFAENNANKPEAIEAKFAMVQLLLSQGAREEAIDVLLSLNEVKYKTGVVSALITLYLALNNKPAASNMLKDAIEWYKTNNVSGNELSAMWRQASEFHLHNGAPDIAASLLGELLQLNPNDQKILAQLVIAYAQIDPKKALEISRKLPKLEMLTTASEIDALESANWVMSAKAAKKSAIGKIEPSPGTPIVEKKKTRRRKRKGKLPKNYNVDILPDPERWLPKYERTGYRKKRDRRTKDVIKGSQGMSTQAAEQYDMSNRVNANKTSPTTPVYQDTPGPRQQHRKGGHKKKKSGRF